LRQAIAGLPSPFLETLVMRDINGLSYREIAEATETPVGTVMSRLARARAMLAKTLRAEA
jgi:DNA-directed RNA polymerase specialized sigma24 family protein